jgi:fido (protein-threonine AMPylation protein)
MAGTGINNEDCPQWEYRTNPQHEVILKRKVIDILVKLRNQELNSAESAADSRAVHRYLFEELTPPGHAYFAGHYRGENFPCLKDYGIGVEDDVRVGCNAAIAPQKMEQIAQMVRVGLQLLDTTFRLPKAQFSPVEHLLNTVAFACRVFEQVLRIHPYANGNGHAARFILWAILGRYGYWPKRFPIETRPSEPDYIESLVKYRNGETQPLEEYILRCIIGFGDEG